MITPTTPITIQETFDGIWITNITILAPKPNQKVSATINICPFNSTTGLLNQRMSKVITIEDVYAEAANNSNVAAVMSNIFGYVQDKVTNGEVF